MCQVHHGCFFKQLLGFYIFMRLSIVNDHTGLAGLLIVFLYLEELSEIFS